MERAKILVVDDEPDLREIIAFDFDMAGFEVRCAENGSSAIELLGKEKIDAVVSDVRMPKGDGIQLLTEIRRLKTNALLPMVFITGFSDMTVEEAYDLGIDGIFTKPFDRRALVRFVSSLLIPAHERWKAEKCPPLGTKQRFLIVLPNFEKARLDHQVGVGRGGMFVLKTENFPMVGEMLHFRVEFEDQPLSAIEGCGWVRWVRPTAKGHLQPGVGIEFHSLAPTSISYIQEVLTAFETTSFIPRG